MPRIDEQVLWDNVQLLAPDPIPVGWDRILGTSVEIDNAAGQTINFNSMEVTLQVHDLDPDQAVDGAVRYYLQMVIEKEVIAGRWVPMAIMEGQIDESTDEPVHIVDLRSESIAELTSSGQQSLGDTPLVGRTKINGLPTSLMRVILYAPEKGSQAAGLEVISATVSVFVRLYNS